MITALTPDQVAWAMEKIFQEGKSKAWVAGKLEVRRHTLFHALEVASMFGFSAFSIRMLKARVEGICRYRTLHECHLELMVRKLYSGSRESLRRSLGNVGIEYVKNAACKDK